MSELDEALEKMRRKWIHNLSRLATQGANHAVVDAFLDRQGLACCIRPEEFQEVVTDTRRLHDAIVACFDPVFYRPGPRRFDGLLQRFEEFEWPSVPALPEGRDEAIRLDPVWQWLNRTVSILSTPDAQVPRLHHPLPACDAQAVR